MKVGSKILESKVVIRFPDCDPFGHLNNSRYIDYFINAREDQLLKNYELDVYQTVQEKGLSWVVAQNQIAYLKPANLMEKVIIQSQMIEFDNRFVQVEMRMYSNDRQALKALLWTKFASYNVREQKVEGHGEEYINFFHAICEPIPEKLFEERVDVLRNQRKPVL